MNTPSSAPNTMALKTRAVTKVLVDALAAFEISDELPELESDLRREHDELATVIDDEQHLHDV